MSERSSFQHRELKEDGGSGCSGSGGCSDTMDVRKVRITSAVCEAEIERKKRSCQLVKERQGWEGG